MRIGRGRSRTVDDTEDRGVRADAERKGHHGEDGEGRRFRDHAKGVRMSFIEFLIADWAG